MAVTRYRLAMISTWIFEFFHALRDPALKADPEAVQSHFRWYLDLWTHAEARGFDGIFFSEHHFGAAYSPSPNLLVATMAQRTTTLRLGVLGTVTPYATPWRVAEEFAMLDHLTGGRFEPGIVSGIPPELGLAGIPLNNGLARHGAVASVIDAARSGEAITIHDEEFSFDGLEIFPPSYHPKTMWTAVRSRESAERAARRGWKICAGFNATPVIADCFDGYRAAASDAGFQVGPEHLGLRRLITFTDDATKRREAMHTGKRLLLDLLNASAGALPPFAALLDRPDEQSDVLSDDEFVSGTPEQVADELVRQCRAVGAGNMVACFSAVDHGELEHAHAAFAEVVIPALRAAGV
jgi:alkanesulfonate monooxygenase SsuD/methylene tetrahydromethanopterin reductase-like flavin-dependent oxidoreductase (luciferase family)